MKQLAIVIPAYKDKYLVKALSSLVAQTNQDFTVYIGDDYSPNNIKSVVNQFADKLDIFYTRFDNNIGAEKLVNQWNRCIKLTKDEKWLWLFSDDDLLDSTCVENFYKKLNRQQSKFDVYRFNTCIIDGEDHITNVMPVSPDEETSEQMAYHLLLTNRGNSMPDHIFSREVYEKYGGFVFTSYAQGADWAMSMLFSKEKGMCVIPKSRVYWRLSGSNVSSVTKERKADMLRGHIEFINWILDHFSYLKEENNDITYDMIVKAAMYNLGLMIASHYKGFDNTNIIRCYNLMRNKLKWPLYTTVDTLLSMGMHTEFFMNKLHRMNVLVKKTFKLSV